MSRHGSKDLGSNSISCYICSGYGCRGLNALGNLACTLQFAKKKASTIWMCNLCAFGSARPMCMCTRVSDLICTCKHEWEFSEGTLDVIFNFKFVRCCYLPRCPDTYCSLYTFYIQELWSCASHAAQFNGFSSNNFFFLLWTKKKKKFLVDLYHESYALISSSTKWKRWRLFFCTK